MEMVLCCGTNAADQVRVRPARSPPVTYAPPHLIGDASPPASGPARGLAEILLHLSTTFVAAPAGAIDSRIQAALALIGEATGSDRAYVFRVLPDGATVRNTHEWCAEDIQPEIDNLQDLPTEHMSDAWRLLAAGEVVHLPDVANLDSSWDAAKEVLLEQGIQSLVLVPMPGPEGTSGFIGFDAVRTQRTWDQHEVAVLRIVGDLFEVALQRDAAERRLAHRELHDDLTGLPSRALLTDRLQVALLRRGRTHESLAVLFVDLDQFKLVNESLGHESGDDVLRITADRISASLRPGDTISRFGADEFVVVCEDLQGIPEACALAERLTAALSEPLTIDGRELVLTASVGATVAAEGERDAGRLLQRADVALRQAKASGRGAINVLDADRGEAAVAQLGTEGELRRALERDELHLHYQPIIETATGEMSGVEALIRWTHPVRGSVPPLDFIPLAERSGLIIPIGRWVLHRATLDIAALSARIGRPLELAVNISARQLLDPMLATDVETALAASGLPADALLLEVTETALIDDPAAAVAAVERLRALGIHLALDDFGTGWSSLAYLRDLRIDHLKIDRSFIADLADQGTHDIVRSVVQLAHGLGLQVVAEGVETEAVLAAVAALGCERWQGYLASKPVPVAKLATSGEPAPSPAPDPSTLDGIAQLFGADDLFVLRRVSPGRYAHLGGVGRGEGWAGIVELDTGASPWLQEVEHAGRATRIDHDRAEHVFGPYYARSVLLAFAGPDALVLAGRADDLLASDAESHAAQLARAASDLVDAVSPAKRLSDELELLEAVQRLLQYDGTSVEGALHHITRTTTEALSCEVGLFWHRETDAVGVVDRDGTHPFDPVEVRRALPTLIDLAGDGPRCGQDINASPLPDPFDASAGIRSWYLVPLPRDAGFLVLLHTRTPRGFTDLCRQLGLRMADAASMVLDTTRNRERLKLEIARVSTEARTDPLTGLPNRLAWEEAVAERRARLGECTAVVFADLDGLKETNDNLGHHAGDDLLRAAAALLGDAVRDGDLVARIGGDEFGLLLPGMCASACDDLVEDLRRVAGSPPLAEAAGWSLALGFAVCESGHELDHALRRADAAMYDAKRSARARRS